MSSPDLLFFGFCFLFFISYLPGSFRAAGAGGDFGRGRGKFCIFMLFGGSPLSHAAKRHDSSPAGGAKCTCVNPGKVCGKAKPQKSSSYHKVFLCPWACTWLSLRESWREAPERGASHACGTAQLRRCLRQKQPKRSRGSGLLFASPQRRAQQKQGTATMPPQAAERAKNWPQRSDQPKKKSARFRALWRLRAFPKIAFCPIPQTSLLPAGRRVWALWPSRNRARGFRACGGRALAAGRRDRPACR